MTAWKAKVSKPYFSKSRFLAGLQCPKMLWWMVHEPDAPELTVTADRQPVFDQGKRVSAIARTYVPGGVLIDLPYYEIERRVAATTKALAGGAPAVYEASFLEDGVFVAVDILERTREGFVLVEVKATLDAKDQHLPDVAVQMHVARRAGLEVKHAELMHLNRHCRYPDLSNLFVRRNLTPVIRSALRAVPTQIRELKSHLAGPLPMVATGSHCTSPYPCAFLERCWPRLPEHHVSTLYKITARKAGALVAKGYETLLDLPRNFAASGPAGRQIKSARSGTMIVEPELRRALAALTPPIAFLDFEALNPAIPVWPGCGPFAHVPVQFSCHVLTSDGLEHHEWVAPDRTDPREPLARAVIAACHGAETVLAYYAPFERRCIAGLIQALPDLAHELTALSARIRDLLPIVQDHIYHPDFAGSFSIKKVLPALVPGFGYDDLKIQDGYAASAALGSLLFDTETMPAAARRELRRDLLQYCKRDTLAMVRLLETLRELSNDR